MKNENLKMSDKNIYDIIIQAGQSNSEGCGLGAVEREFVPRKDILYMNRDFSVSQAYEREDAAFGKVNEYALSFCEEYIKEGKLKKGRKLLVLRSAVGGTGFADKRWGLKDDLYLTMTEMIKKALLLNPENKLVAFLWHQGETDASYRASYDAHYQNIKNLVGSVRDTFKVPALPFACGDFVQEWKNSGADVTGVCEPVILALRDYCKKTKNARFVESDGLTSNHEAGVNDDIIHFSRNALFLFGIRYYEALKELI